MAKWRAIKKKKRVQKPLSSLEDGIKSSSLGLRFKAFLTDSFLITTPITYIVMYLILGGGDDFAQNRLLGWGLILGITSLFIIFFWYVKVQTPGMKAYSLKIISLDNKRVSFMQTLVRFIATLFALMSFFLLFIPFFTKDKKSFQDIISRTIIVEE